MSIETKPESTLEHFIALAAQRTEPIAVDSPEGQQLYRALAQHVWVRQQRPVSAGDIRELWERIDTLKRGSQVQYGIWGIHFWAAEYANALAAQTVALDPAGNERLAAWLDDWPNICILGQTGRGKSTTINRLFGARMTETSHHRPCTDTVTDYRLVTGQFLNRPTGVVLWDVPGYGDARLPWEKYVKLYKRMAKRCDVVLFMLDHERTLPDDLEMFRKLRKKMGSDARMVVAINKADLFHPCTWDETLHAPSAAMLETLNERVGLIAQTLELQTRRIVPISALKNWNLFGLLAALVDAAGENKGARLLQSVNTPALSGESPETAETAQRFGINSKLRKRFRAVIENARAAE